MKKIDSKQILNTAKKEGYGVLAVNCDTVGMIQGVVEAAKECRSPVIIQTTEGAVNYLGVDYIVSAYVAALKNTDLPVALHLDHGQDYNLIMKCIRAGYTSVMIDASMYEFEENVERTKRVADVARALNINVEGELGRVGGVEEDIIVEDAYSTLADPEECKHFVNLTGVSCLAPAIGTAHGIYKSAPRIDLERIKDISSRIEMPLALHGGSGVPDDLLKKCIALGMAKINVGTEIKYAYADTMKQYIEEFPSINDARKFLGAARDRVKDLVIEKMKIVGSVNRY